MTDFVTQTDAQIKADADPRVLHPLDQLRGTIRRFVVLDGLAAAGLFILAWFWIGLLLDFGLFKLTGFDWVLDAPHALRTVTFLAVLTLLGSVLFRRVYLRLNREFSYPSLALILEKRFPKLLGDRLITAVELADIPRAKAQGYSVEMVRQTIQEAREIVGQVPVDSVFNWSRLRSKVITGLAVMLGLIVLSFVMFGAAGMKESGAGEAFSPLGFAGKFSDTATIWTERNLFLLDTPWPRRAHMELVKFPDAGLKISKGGQNSKLLAPGTDSRSPHISARAFRYIVADRSKRLGWRPLSWKDDVAKFVNGVNIPRNLTVQLETGWTPTEVSYASVFGTTSFPGAAYPAKPHTRNVNLDELSADEVFEQFHETHAADVGAVFDELDKVAARSSMSRTFRKLKIPDLVTLNYRGKPTIGESGAQTGRTSGEIHLNPEPNGEYTCEVTPFKESVYFTLRAEDFRSDPRDVLLDNPPMLTRLSHLDRQPAYLYHPAPVDEKNPDGPPNFQLLKGLRQVMPEKEMSLTGDKSVCTVPAGTDLVLTAVADKTLKAAYIIPKAGVFPGAAPGKTDPIEVKERNDKTVVINFKDASRISQTVDFDLVLVDEDGVESVRPVLIQAAEDQAPQVDVMVDVLRKVSSTYYCTARARIPFVANSIIKDDTGLSSVKYVFTVNKIDSNSMVTLQAQTMGTLFAFAPIISNFGSAIGPYPGFMYTLAAAKSTTPTGKPLEMDVQPFDRAYSDLQKDTINTLRDKLSKPSDRPDERNTVLSIKYGQFEADGLDLEVADKKLKREQNRQMMVEGFESSQPKHRIDLRIVARDANVETGPKEGQTIEPIRLTVVSEADLLVEVSKDEDLLITKLDEAISKLRNARGNFSTWRDRLAALTLTEQDLRAASTRVEDMNLDLSKSKDLCQSANIEFTRLRREMEVNRVAWEQDESKAWSSRNAKKYDKDIIKPMESLLAGEFKGTEDAFAALRSSLAENKTPGDERTRTASDQLAGLIERLEAIKAGFGESVSLNKSKMKLQSILAERNELVKAEADRIEYLSRIQREPLIALDKEITLLKGITQKIKTSVEWKGYGGDKMQIHFEAPEGLETPKAVEISDEALEFDLTGTKPGEYVLKATPYNGDKPVGQTVTCKVIVK